MSYSHASRTRRENVRSQKGHAFLYLVASFAWEQLYALLVGVYLRTLHLGGCLWCIVRTSWIAYSVYLLVQRQPATNSFSLNPSATTRHTSLYAKICLIAHHFPRYLYNHKQSYSTQAPTSYVVCPHSTVSCVGSAELSISIRKYFDLSRARLICTRSALRPYDLIWMFCLF